MGMSSYSVELEEVENLKKTEGEGGFGSTE